MIRIFSSILITLIVVLGSSSAAKGGMNLEVCVHINHNNCFSQPKLPTVITCRDCSGFRSLPATGFGLQILTGKLLNEKFRLYYGVLLEYYYTALIQDSAVAKQLFAIGYPAVEMHYVDRILQIPIGVAYRIKSFQFFAGLHNAFLNYPTEKYFTLDGKVVYGAKNKFVFGFILIPNVGLMYTIPKNNIGISFSSDLIYQNDTYYKLGLTYTFY